MDARAALAFVREHGVALVSARGPVPTLTHAIAGARRTFCYKPIAVPGTGLVLIWPRARPAPGWRIHI
jgi:hypothetical protein